MKRGRREMERSRKRRGVREERRGGERRAGDMGTRRRRGGYVEEDKEEGEAVTEAVGLGFKGEHRSYLGQGTVAEEDSSWIPGET